MNRLSTESDRGPNRSLPEVGGHDLGCTIPLRFEDRGVTDPSLGVRTPITNGVVTLDEGVFCGNLASDQNEASFSYIANGCLIGGLPPR